MSSIDAAKPDLNARIAIRVRLLRNSKGLSLDALASRSNVSRSMLSLIERAEASPTAVILEKIATALGVSLAGLFDDPQQTSDPLSRQKDRLSWRDPQTGYVRTNISPAGFHSPIRIVEIAFPGGASVSYETAEREQVIHQQIWVQHGKVNVQVGEVLYNLVTGDCLAMELNAPVSFHNPTKSEARYVVVITTETAAASPRRKMTSDINVRRVSEITNSILNGLADVLVDCTETGASIGFLSPLTHERALWFWEKIVDDVASGKRILFVAEDHSGAIVGTVHVILEEPENQPHRGDLAKMLVCKHARRRGIGDRLLAAAENAAASAGKTLLVLDTASADAERLYERHGWIRCGVIPGYALTPDGALCATTFYYKNLFPFENYQSEGNAEAVAD